MNTKKTILACVVVLAIGALAGWVLNLFKAEPTKTTPVTRARLVSSLVVESANQRIDVDSQGTVAPRTEIDLVVQVAGEATMVSDSLETGSFFAKGEVLVQLDQRDYDLEVIRASAAVAQAKVQLSWQQAEADVARREWEALGKGEASPLTVREPQVQEAEAALAAAEATLRQAEIALERTTIRAPFAGRVRSKSVDTGQFVSQGTKIARVYAVDYAEIRLPLHDSKLRYLDLPLTYGNRDQGTGPDVTLSARFAQQMQKWTAKIVRTEGEIDPRSRMIHAIARIRDPYGQLPSSNGTESHPRSPLAVGMFVQASIHGKVFDDVFEIPRDALREGDTILVIDAELRMHRRDVGVLHRGETSVVIDRGLADGERICLSPIAVFVENMQVELAKTAGEVPVK